MRDVAIATRVLEADDGTFMEQFPVVVKVRNALTTGPLFQEEACGKDCFEALRAIIADRLPRLLSPEAAAAFVLDLRKPHDIVWREAFDVIYTNADTPWLRHACGGAEDCVAGFRAELMDLKDQAGAFCRARATLYATVLMCVRPTVGHWATTAFTDQIKQITAAYEKAIRMGESSESEQAFSVSRKLLSGFFDTLGARVPASKAVFETVRSAVHSCVCLPLYIFCLSLQIKNVHAASARIERLFSDAKGVKTENRSRMHTSTLLASLQVSTFVKDIGPSDWASGTRTARRACRTRIVSKPFLPPC